MHGLFCSIQLERDLGELSHFHSMVSSCMRILFKRTHLLAANGDTPQQKITWNDYGWCYDRNDGENHLYLWNYVISGFTDFFEFVFTPKIVGEKKFPPAFDLNMFSSGLEPLRKWFALVLWNSASWLLWRIFFFRKISVRTVRQSYMKADRVRVDQISSFEICVLDSGHPFYFCWMTNIRVALGWQIILVATCRRRRWLDPGIHPQNSLQDWEL